MQFVLDFQSETPFLQAQFNTVLAPLLDQHHEIFIPDPLLDIFLPQDVKRHHLIDEWRVHYPLGYTAHGHIILHLHKRQCTAYMIPFAFDYWEALRHIGILTNFVLLHDRQHSLQTLAIESGYIGQNELIAAASHWQLTDDTLIPTIAKMSERYYMRDQRPLQQT